MNILLTGANGFIGKIVHQALSLQGHTVVRAVRRPNLPSDIAVDFEQDTTAETWIPRLNNIDAIVNTVGIMGGTETQMMAVHCHTPSALAQAAAQKNIQYLDVHTAMLDENKEVFKDIFISDKLHMNPKGYLIWQKQFAPYLTTPK